MVGGQETPLSFKNTVITSQSSNKFFSEMSRHCLRHSEAKSTETKRQVDTAQLFGTEPAKLTKL